MTFYPLEKTALLHDNYRRTFRVAGRHLLLLQHEGRPVLLDNICPHAGYPMEHGMVLDGNLRCPMHGYLFSLQSGACMAAYEGPCEGIRVYEVVEKGEDIGVLL